MKTPKPLALIILDGYGLSNNIEGNAVKAAHTPYLDKLFAQYPHSRLQASGEAVGLPAGQMGNSEVGHLNLGAGRIVNQEYTRLNKAVKKGKFNSNEILQKAVENVKKHDSALHLLGLLSNGGVHSHIRHLYGLLEMAKKEKIDKVYVHAIMDGRDTPPKSGIKYIKELETRMKKMGVGKIATVSGRYFAMDRDTRWDRTQRAYDALVLGDGEKAKDAVTVVEDSYVEDVGDEFILPAVIKKNGKPVATINGNDSVIFYNFRADRARQITRALALPDFSEFERPPEHPENIYFVCMTEYDEDFDLPVAYPPLKLENILGEVLSKHRLKQLRIAETEKYAHVTFFFNGGDEKTFPGEDRELIPSPRISTYDLQPEMSAFKVTDSLLEKLKLNKYDVVILNFANPDMVGHTGIFKAAVAAIEAVDKCLRKLIPAILNKGGQVLLTADHGNSERMVDENGEPHTAHTTNPVPFIYIGEPEKAEVKNGILADIAPTILAILDIEKPEEMTGNSLIVK